LLAASVPLYREHVLREATVSWLIYVCSRASILEPGTVTVVWTPAKSATWNRL